ncbi:MAG: hypothetical protein WC716_12115 [Chitinophagaceae bacterium]|jgi:hypothetical protein
MKYSFYCLLFLALGACTHSKKVTQPTPVSRIEETDSSQYRFGISFYSIGAGIDGVARQQMMDYIRQFEQKEGVTLTYEKYAWGKEGEQDYCFRLNELSPGKQEYFITQIKETLKKSTRVHYKEHSDCAR